MRMSHAILGSALTRFAVVLGMIAAGAFGVMAAGGCATTPPATVDQTPPTRPPNDPAIVQNAVMGFADRYLTAVADACNKVREASPTPKRTMAVHRQKMEAGFAAIANAVNPSPYAGLMDMAILVTLSREVMEDPWARDAFGPEGVAILLATLKPREDEIWRIAGSYLTEAQVAELRALAAQWRREHPGQRYVAGVRLATFPQFNQADAPGHRPAQSVFGLLGLDPFAGLDPALRQIEQSRVLAERMFFYARHMPLLVSWQADALYMQMLAAPQVEEVLRDVSQVTDAARQIADTSAQLGRTLEWFRIELPQHRIGLVLQLESTVARERDAALKQAAAAIAVERDLMLKQAAAVIAVERDLALKQAAAAITAERRAAIEQFNTLALIQQQILADNLRQVSDRSVAQAYDHARTLVLMMAASAALVALLGIVIAARLRRRGAADAAADRERAISDLRGNGPKALGGG